MFAYSEKRVGIQNVVAAEQEQNKPSSSFWDNKEEQHINSMQPNTRTKLLQDNHSFDTSRRRVQIRRGENNNGYGAYDVPPTSNTNTASVGSNNNNDNNDSNKGATGWFGKKQDNDNTGGNDSAAISSTNAYNTGSAAYGSTGSSAYGSYGSSPSSPSSPAYGSYGSAAGSSNTNSAAYGSAGSSSGSYGSTSAYGGAASPRSSSYGGSSYSSTWGTGSASSASNRWGSNTNNFRGGKGLHPVKIDLFKAIFFLLLISATGMLLTAHSMERHPEGTFANCCRVSLQSVICVYSIIYNLYHCRLGELPGIICGGTELEEDEYTEEELERMNLRPGIERALDTEHRKALRKVGVDMNMIKPKNGRGDSKANGDGGKSKGARNGAASRV